MDIQFHLNKTDNYLFISDSKDKKGNLIFIFDFERFERFVPGDPESDGENKVIRKTIVRPEDFSSHFKLAQDLGYKICE